ncbi:MAG: hypothetical protein KC635_04970 [Myxococcales bacterium]|nr:hypothetical protein [Myxococcales bacterium]MCB9732318.1 hypothetical protein [Deltaproteobacteria bacterium]
MLRATRAALFIAVLSSLPACGDDGPSMGADSDTDVAITDTVLPDGGADSVAGDTVTTDAGDAADTATPPASLSVRILSAPPSPGPLPGATVLLVDPSGARHEQTTDSDGAVTFADAVDWSAGDGRVTLAVVAPGYAARALAGFRQADLAALPWVDGGELRLPLRHPEAGPADAVTLTGTFSNLVDESHTTLVGASVPAVPHRGVGADLELSVAPGMAFRWVAFELEEAVSGRSVTRTIHRAVDGVHSAVGADGAWDVNLGTESPTLSTAAGAFPIPDDPDGDLDTASTASVEVAFRGDWAHGPLLGVATDLRPAADGGTFEFEVAWVTPAFATSQFAEVLTTFALTTPSTRSVALVDGFPTAGSQDVALLLPPRLTAPPSAGEQAFDEVVAWSSAAADAYPMVVYTQGPDALVVGEVFLPPGASELTPFEGPGGADPFSALGVTSLDLRVGVCELDAGLYSGSGGCRRFALSASATVTAPE